MFPAWHGAPLAPSFGHNPLDGPPAMPLPPASPREPIHTRQVECRGYRRADGLWDIEGHLVDVKAYAFDNAHRGRLEPGMPIHEMWIRLTIDDEFMIHDAVAATDASPYRICPEVAPNFA